MIRSSTKYAVDLSNDGVSLWHREIGQSWKLLGESTLSSKSFSADIGKLKEGQKPNTEGSLIAEIRIPSTEVFVSDIDINGIHADTLTAFVNDFLSKNTPYAAHDLLFDLENGVGTEKAYIAAITKETIEEAKSFITSHGFEAAYYTAQLDKNDFPRAPKFYDSDQSAATTAPSTPPRQASSIKTATKAVSKSLPPLKSPRENAEPDIIAGKATPTLNVSAPKEAETQHAGATPLKASDKTDLSGFETVRSRTLITQDESTDKAADIADASSPVIPQPRISIGITTPETEDIAKKTISVPSPITTPQGDAIRTDVRGLFKLRYVFTFAALALIVLFYWFYTALFDGKAEIARLQQISTTAPTIISESGSLRYQASTDTAPTLEQVLVTKITQNPALKIPETIANPALIAAQNPETTGANINTDNISTNTTSPTSKNPDQTVLPETIPNPTEYIETAGTLVPTKEGTPGAEGITLFLGQPDILPTRRVQLKISPDPLKDILPKMRSQAFEKDHKSEAPQEPIQQTVTAAEIVEQPEPAVSQTLPPSTVDVPDIFAIADLSLKDKQPIPRPATIAGISEDMKNSLLAKADPTLAGIKPRRRPAGLSVPPKVTVLASANSTEIRTAIQQAVQELARPRARPASLSSTVAKANNSNIQTAALLPPSNTAGTSKASSPSPVNIQKEATEHTRFNKKRISLIGVFGTQSSRHALVRMPSGRIVPIKPGQSFSGWKVAAIGESTVRIIKGNRNQVLRMPK